MVRLSIRDRISFALHGCCELRRSCMQPIRAPASAALTWASGLRNDAPPRERCPATPQAWDALARARALLTGALTSAPWSGMGHVSNIIRTFFPLWSTVTAGERSCTRPRQRARAKACTPPLGQALDPKRPYRPTTGEHTRWTLHAPGTTDRDARPAPYPAASPEHCRALLTFGL